MKKASKKSKKAPAKYERMKAGAKAPPGLTPAERKAWIAATTGSGAGFWKPEKIGDTLLGKLVSAGTQKGKFGTQRVLNVETKSGVVRVYCGSVLEREYDEKAPKLGSRIIIVYQGKAKGQKGNPAHLFGLSVVKG